MRVQRPYAHCCAEGGGSVEHCDCVNKDHGTAWFDIPDRTALPIAQFGAAIAVTQADREAAADVWRDYVAKIGECIVENHMRKGALDDGLPAAFARHRTAPALPLAHPAAPQGEDIAAEAAARIVRDYRPEGWPAKEAEIARYLLSKFAALAPAAIASGRGGAE